jgi:hypothetical protein
MKVRILSILAGAANAISRSTASCRVRLTPTIGNSVIGSWSWYYGVDLRVGRSHLCTWLVESLFWLSINSSRTCAQTPNSNLCYPPLNHVCYSSTTLKSYGLSTVKDDSGLKVLHHVYFRRCRVKHATRLQAGHAPARDEDNTASQSHGAVGARFG